MQHTVAHSGNHYGRGTMARLDLRRVRVYARRHSRTRVRRMERTSGAITRGTEWGGRWRERVTRSKGGRDARRATFETLLRSTCVSRESFPSSSARIDSTRGEDAPEDHRSTRPRRRPRMSDNGDLSDATIPASRRSAREILRRRSRPVVQGEVKSRACVVDGRARAAYAQEASALLQLCFQGEAKCKCI